MSTKQPVRMKHPYASDATMNDVQVVDVMETTGDFHQLVSPRYKRLVSTGSTTAQSTVSHQLQPRGTGTAREVLCEVFLAHRFENAGVGELATGEDAEEGYDVCVRQAATDEGVAVEPLYSGG